MNNEQIKQLEKELWDAADNLRANSKLTAAEYKDPVLGLILLRYAQNRFEDAKVVLEPKLTGPRGKREATQADFLAAGAMMLPEKSQYDYLANLPEAQDITEDISSKLDGDEGAIAKQFAFVGMIVGIHLNLTIFAFQMYACLGNWVCHTRYKHNTLQKAGVHHRSDCQSNFPLFCF